MIHFQKFSARRFTKISLLLTLLAAFSRSFFVRFAHHIVVLFGDRIVYKFMYNKSVCLNRYVFRLAYA